MSPELHSAAILSVIAALSCGLGVCKTLGQEGEGGGAVRVGCRALKL
jgi:hypothetical protein